MLISDHTLLLAVGFSCLCVVVMFIVTWFSTRSEPFLLTWAVGAGMIAFTAFGFAVYNVNMTPWVGVITFGSMIIGLGVQLASAEYLAYLRGCSPASWPPIETVRVSLGVTAEAGKVPWGADVRMARRV